MVVAKTMRERYCVCTRSVNHAIICARVIKLAVLCLVVPYGVCPTALVMALPPISDTMRIPDPRVEERHAACNHEFKASPHPSNSV